MDPPPQPNPNPSARPGKSGRAVGRARRDAAAEDAPEFLHWTDLTKFEYTKVVSMRSAQLDNCAPSPFAPATGETSTGAAARELAASQTPFVVVRTLPEGRAVKYRLWQ